MKTICDFFGVRRLHRDIYDQFVNHHLGSHSCDTGLVRYTGYSIILDRVCSFHIRPQILSVANIYYPQPLLQDQGEASLAWHVNAL